MRFFMEYILYIVCFSKYIKPFTFCKNQSILNEGIKEYNYKLCNMLYEILIKTVQMSCPKFHIFKLA